MVSSVLLSHCYRPFYTKPQYRKVQVSKKMVNEDLPYTSTLLEKWSAMQRTPIFTKGSPYGPGKWGPGIPIIFRGPFLHYMSCIPSGPLEGGWGGAEKGLGLKSAGGVCIVSQARLSLGRVWPARLGCVRARG